jgi:phosphate starvation-inducible protein PhoH and related proteins
LTEKSYLIEEVDPLELLGVNHNNLRLLQSYFTKLRIVSRGNELIIKGDEKEMVQLEQKLALMTEHIRKFGKLNTNFLEELVHMGK